MNASVAVSADEPVLRSAAQLVTGSFAPWDETRSDVGPLVGLALKTVDGVEVSMPRFDLQFRETAAKRFLALQAGRTSDLPRCKKVTSKLALLASNPHHPGLCRHRWDRPTDEGSLWESYVENRCPSAWPIWWRFGCDASTTVVDLGPHP